MLKKCEKSCSFSYLSLDPSLPWHCGKSVLPTLFLFSCLRDRVIFPSPRPLQIKIFYCSIENTLTLVGGIFQNFSLHHSVGFRCVRKLGGQLSRYDVTQGLRVQGYCNWHQRGTVYQCMGPMYHVRPCWGHHVLSESK